LFGLEKRFSISDSGSGFVLKMGVAEKEAEAFVGRRWVVGSLGRWVTHSRLLAV
jgi:hypothetical protein